MIDLYYWTTPNGHKITIFFEETGVPYRLHPVNIGKGEQFDPDYLKISPNNKIPAIVDTAPSDNEGPLSLFESGAILWYLAEKYQKFMPKTIREKVKVSEWLFWQVGSIGPMLGQNHHFSNYAPEKIPYAIDRYVKETNRLYGVLNKQLQGKQFIVGEYSIVDMAVYPWIVPWEKQGQNLDDFPNIKRWFESVGNRPAVKKAYEIAESINKDNTITDEAKKILFGQSSRNQDQLSNRLS